MHASNAVDGEVFAVPGQPTPLPAETEKEDLAGGGPWWEVELGEEYEIVAVDVTAALRFYPPSRYPEARARLEGVSAQSERRASQCPRVREMAQHCTPWP